MVCLLHFMAIYFLVYYPVVIEPYSFSFQGRVANLYTKYTMAAKVKPAMTNSGLICFISTFVSLIWVWMGLGLFCNQFMNWFSLLIVYST